MGLEGLTEGKRGGLDLVLSGQGRCWTDGEDERRGWGLEEGEAHAGLERRRESGGEPSESEQDIGSGGIVTEVRVCAECLTNLHGNAIGIELKPRPGALLHAPAIFSMRLRVLGGSQAMPSLKVPNGLTTLGIGRSWDPSTYAEPSRTEWEKVPGWRDRAQGPARSPPPGHPPLRAGGPAPGRDGPHRACCAPRASRRCSARGSAGRRRTAPGPGRSPCPVAAPVARARRARDHSAAGRPGPTRRPRRTRRKR